MSCHPDAQNTTLGGGGGIGFARAPAVRRWTVRLLMTRVCFQSPSSLTNRLVGRGPGQRRIGHAKAQVMPPATEPGNRRGGGRVRDPNPNCNHSIQFRHSQQNIRTIPVWQTHLDDRLPLRDAKRALVISGLDSPQTAVNDSIVTKNRHEKAP